MTVTMRQENNKTEEGPSAQGGNVHVRHIQVMHLMYFRVSVHISSMVFQIQTEKSLPSTWGYRKYQWINCI